VCVLALVGCGCSSTSHAGQEVERHERAAEVGPGVRGKRHRRKAFAKRRVRRGEGGEWQERGGLKGREDGGWGEREGNTGDNVQYLLMSTGAGKARR
jgi:hypothetical protein